MKKLSGYIGLVLFTSIMVFAQESEQIELPEVTTVIKGESITAGLDSLPDFENVLVIEEDSGLVVPVLPEVEIKENSDSEVAVQTVEEKTIYAEGLLGGGYPSVFLGDFSVYRQNGESPFNITFHHNSAAGYSGSPLTQGFNNRDTYMAVEKGICVKNVDISFGGLYEAQGQGMQMKVPYFSDVDNDTINAFANINWKLPYGFNVGSEFALDYYDRYLDSAPVSSDFSCPQWISLVNTYGINPSLFANWSGYGFNVDLKGNYYYRSLLLDENQFSHRGDLAFGLSWKKDFVKLFGNVGAVFGNAIEGESVVVPFTLGVDTSFPVYFSNRKFALKLEGGLVSYSNSIADFEKKYKYTAVSSLLNESSEWYGQMDLSLPLKSSFTGNVAIDFRKTAFDNGRYLPAYVEDCDNARLYGLYYYDYKNSTMLTTDFNVAYHYKIFSFTAGWHSNWIDVPVLETPHMILLNVSLQSEASKWGINLLGKFGFGDDLPVPVINADCFYRVTSAVRIVISAEDIIKLAAGNRRIYAGQYFAEGGKVSCLVKFFF